MSFKIAGSKIVDKNAILVRDEAIQRQISIKLQNKFDPISKALFREEQALRYPNTINVSNEPSLGMLIANDRDSAINSDSLQSYSLARNQLLTIADAETTDYILDRLDDNDIQNLNQKFPSFIKTLTTKYRNIDKKNTSLQKFVDDKYYKYLNSYCFKENEKYKALLAVATEDSIPSINKSLHNLKVYTNAILQLRINSTRNGLITDIITKITNNDIILNSNPYLFAFDNKIYDLKNNSFITAHKDQYITSTCGYNYSDFYPESRVITYRKLIDTIFPDKNVRDYYLTILATGLFGQQIEKLFVATGNGGNGKSLLNSQMLETVGNYGYKLGANVLLDVIKQGANPEVANMHRKRFVLCQEPDNKKLVCTATVKELTGDKEINARQLYSGDTKTLLNLTLIMECNQLPRLDEVTGGVQRRLEAIPFDARFVDKDTYDSLKNKSSLGIANPLYKTTEFQDEHRQALFIILLDYWKQFQINNYSMQSLPEVCKLITKDYMAMSDDIYGWFMEYYEPGDNSTDLVYIDEIFKTLKISEMFSLMSKKEQKNLTAKSFNEKIEKNIFLRENYLERKLYFNGDRLSKPALCGYIKKATPLLIED